LVFNVFYPDVNFSDHLPLSATFNLYDSAVELSKDGSPADSATARVHKRLRWDKGNRTSYYGYTSVLESMICMCDTVVDSLRGSVNHGTVLCDGNYQSFVDKIYNEVVRVMN